MRRILVPVDGSEHALRAVDFAVLLAQGLDASLDIVSVIDFGQLEFYEGFYMNDEQLRRWQGKVKDGLLADARRRVPEDGPPASTRTLEGRVINELLHDLRTNMPLCVVVGRQGKGALESMLVGSVSARLVKLSPVPVVVVN